MLSRVYVKHYDHGKVDIFKYYRATTYMNVNVLHNLLANNTSLGFAIDLANMSTSCGISQSPFVPDGRPRQITFILSIFSGRSSLK